MTYPSAKIVKQYMDGESKRELMRIYKIGDDTLHDILNGAKRATNIKTNPIPKHMGIYAERDAAMMNLYAALRKTEEVKVIDQMKNLGIRTNKSYNRGVRNET